MKIKSLNQPLNNNLFEHAIKPHSNLIISLSSKPILINLIIETSCTTRAVAYIPPGEYFLFATVHEHVKLLNKPLGNYQYGAISKDIESANKSLEYITSKDKCTFDALLRFHAEPWFANKMCGYNHLSYMKRIKRQVTIT